MDISNVVKLNYIDSETGKSFKTVPKHYKSSFNKLTLFRNEYKIYCEPIENYSFNDNLDNCEVSLISEWLKQEVNTYITDKLLTSTKVGMVI